MRGIVNISVLFIEAALMAYNVYVGIAHIARGELEAAAFSFAAASFLLPIAVYFAVICGRQMSQ